VFGSEESWATNSCILLQDVKRVTEMEEERLLPDENRVSTWLAAVSTENKSMPDNSRVGTWLNI
jgi:hypothetical protein